MLLLFFLWWMVPSLLFFFLPVPEKISALQHDIAFLFFAALYLLLASSLAHKVMLHVLAQRSRAPIVLGALVVVMLFVVLYLYVSLTGHSGMLVAGMATANLLFGASLAGAALSSAVKRSAELVPVCLTAAAADCMSVLTGPTKAMIEEITSYYQRGMEGTPPFVDFIVVKIAIPGVDIPIPLFGVTDWIFVVLLSSALLRQGHSDNLMPGRFSRPGGMLFLPLTAAALWLGLVLAQLLQLFLPAMVFIAMAFLLYLVARLQVHRHMRTSDYVYSLIFPAAVVVGLHLFSS